MNNNSQEKKLKHKSFLMRSQERTDYKVEPAKALDFVAAIIIRKKRISAAGCFLPNYSDPSLNSYFGSRHRAAIGMSRTSDAGVIVVSEEDGKISYANGGELSRGIDEDTLRDILFSYYGVSKKRNK